MRIAHFLNFARAAIAGKILLAPVRKALNTLEWHADRVIRRWLSRLTNARLEGVNSVFQAARSRTCGYRNESTFITMIYLIGSPVGSMLSQVKST
nr:transposase [uncultured Halomonas sp.]